jgi:hypothetical protein
MSSMAAIIGPESFQTALFGSPVRRETPLVSPARRFSSALFIPALSLEIIHASSGQGRNSDDLPDPPDLSVFEPDLDAVGVIGRAGEDFPDFPFGELPCPLVFFQLDPHHHSGGKGTPVPTIVGIPAPRSPAVFLRPQIRSLSCHYGGARVSTRHLTPSFLEGIGLNTWGPGWVSLKAGVMVSRLWKTPEGSMQPNGDCHLFYQRITISLQLPMDLGRLFGLLVIIAGLAVITVNGLATVFAWSLIPPNVFVIGLGLVVIGLIFIWNKEEEATPSA